MSIERRVMSHRRLARLHLELVHQSSWEMTPLLWKVALAVGPTVGEPLVWSEVEQVQVPVALLCVGSLTIARPWESQPETFALTLRVQEPEAPLAPQGGQWVFQE